MRISSVLIILLITSLLITLTDGKGEKDIHITSLDIKFNKTDAIFTINYNFDRISRLYFLMFGTKTMEPRIRALFQDFDYNILRIDRDQTILEVKNISRLERGYYLHNSKKLGYTVDAIYISDTYSDTVKEYRHINSTPNYFYR